jgi:SPP1 family predicted phage head-tail adaptor
VKAGELNRQIVIQSRDAGEDAAGQPVDTWTTLATVWANVRGATGMGSIRQSANQDGVAVELNSYSFRIRYRTDVDAAKRVVFGGQNFDVKQVRHDHAGKEWTDLVCEVGGNDG